MIMSPIHFPDKVLQKFQADLSRKCHKEEKAAFGRERSPLRRLFDVFPSQFPLSLKIHRLILILGVTVFLAVAMLIIRRHDFSFRFII